MQAKTRKIVSLIAALALTITCAISGLVLPVSAEGSAQAVENLVPNGDFEQGAVAPWTGVGGTVTVEDGVGIDGGKALQFAAGGAAEIYWKGFRPELTAGTTYAFTFVSKGPQVRFCTNSVTSFGFTEYTYEYQNDWTSYRVLFTPAEGYTIDANWGFYFRRDTAETTPTYIDNVALTVWDPANDYIVGGDFTVPGMAQFREQFWNDATIKASVVKESDGNKAMFVPTATANLGDHFIFNLPLQVSTDYVLSMDVKGDPINVYLYGGGGISGGDAGKWSTTTASDEYKTYTFEFTTNASNLNTNYIVNITRNMASTLNTAQGTYIDNISLKKKTYATGMTLDKTAAEITVGDTLDLTVSTTPAGSFPAEDVVWTSNNEDAATVVDGVVTAVGKGVATITATAGELSASCVVTVNRPKATAIALNAEALTLRVGNTAELTVSAIPEGSEYGDVVWSTSNDKVATVENGVVTAVGKGQATITATAGELSASCVVTGSTNLLSDGGIDGGKTGNWSGMPAVEDGMIKIPSGTSYNAAYYWKGMKKLDWEGGCYYLVSFDAKGDEIIFMTANASGISCTTTRSISHHATYTDSNNRWARYYSVIKLADDLSGNWINSDWAFHFKTYRADSGASQADTYIDNICIEKIDPAAWSVAEEDFDSDVLNGIIYKATIAELVKKGGGVITADPDDANNKVMAFPADGTSEIVRLKFEHPGNGFFDLTGLFKYTIRYKGYFQNEIAGNSNYLSTKTTVGEDGWTTLEQIVDLNSNSTNDLVWSFGFRTSATEATYVDYIALEEIGYPTSMELDQSEATVVIGDTVELNVTTNPAGAYVPEIVWTSTSDAVATVENGVVTAVGAGEATITVTCGTLTDTFVVTVKKPKATSITLNETSATLDIDDTLNLTVTTDPENAEYEDVVWSTSSEAIATVTQDGVVTAVSEGTVTITATSGTLTAICVVTVNPPPKFVLPNGTFEDAEESGWTYNSTVADKFNAGDAVPILTDSVDGNKYIQIPANGVLIKGQKIDYQVQKDDVIRVSFKIRKNYTGKLRHIVRLYNVVDGYAQPDWIPATSTTSASGNGEWFTYNFYLEADYTTSNFYMLFGTLSANTAADQVVDLDDIEIELMEGKNTYGLNLLYGGDFEDGNIASINDYGSGGLHNDGGVVTVDPDDSTNHVLHMTKSSAQAYFYNDLTIIDKSSTRLKVGDYYRLTYRQKGTGTTNPGILSAGGGTRVALLGEPGTASDEWKTITAYYLINPTSQNTNYGFDFKTTGDVYIDDMELVRLQTATEFTLSPSELILTIGDTETLEINTTPVGAYVPNTTWTSDDDTVATVENGVVTAKGEGTATITATAGDVTASVTVTVNKLMATEIVLNKQAVTLFPGLSETLTISPLPTGGWYDTPVWTTSDETVVTVADGVITAVGPGTATIGVTAGDLATSCSVTVLKDLITGGDFEEGRIGSFANVGADSSKTWYIAEGQGFGGGNALAIDYRKSDRLIKWPTFAPNTTYELSFVAKGPQIFINLWKYAGSVSGWSIPYTQECDGDWTQYKVQFTTGANGFYPAAGYENYFFIPNRSATLEDTTAVTYIDNFSIVQTVPLEGERIIGGDFEVPGPQHWNNAFFKNGWNVVTEADGNKALYIPATDAKVGDRFMQELNLKKNTEYVISFKAKGEPIDLYIHPSYFQSGSGWKQTAQSDDYVTYAYTATTQDSSLNSHYLLNFTRNTAFGGTEGTYIDDVSVREASSDLVVEELLIPGVTGEVKPGTEVIFGVKLTNNGTLAIEGTFPIEYRLDGQTWYTMDYTGTVQPGETKVVLVDRAWTAVEGDYSVSVKVNSNLAVLDASLLNNTAAKRVRVATSNPTLPSYAQSAGFDTLTFADDFNSINTIDMNATGESGYKWYVRRPYGASTVTASDLTVENGILTLKLSDPTYNYGLATVDPKTGNGFSFNKGYLEVRFRIPDPAVNGEGESGVPAIWSLPPEKITGKSAAWVEMDWMEYWGKGLKYWRYTKGYYTITMHDQKLNADGTTEHWYRNSNYSQNGLGDQAWHTMGFVWETGKITAYLDGKQVMSQSYAADSTGSPKAYANEGTLANGVFTGMDTLMQALILGGSADSPLEVDYVYVWQNVEEVEEDPYVYADTTVEGGDIDLGETDLFTVEEAETITVNAKPADGYIMKPGSLKYVLEDGTEVKILNQSLTDMTFGGGEGNIFEFKAPAGVAKITAEFISAENTSFAADTIGTSLRVGEDGVGYDGIRFLTRMNMATTFDPDASTLTVKYNGAEYEVVEIGSLLMRYAEGVELTLDNYKWKSKAYVKGGNMSLVDYTDSYIDFTVIMTKGANVSTEAFNARQYTARGYIVLADANGNKTTVLCDTQLTNSVNGASAAL